MYRRCRRVVPRGGAAGTGTFGSAVAPVRKSVYLASVADAADDESAWRKGALMLTFHRCGVVFGLLVVLVLGGAGCDEQNTYAPPPPPQVTVAQPVRDEIVVHLEFAGRTAPSEAVELRARVSGILENIAFDEGEPVSAGKLLFEIERAPYEAALEAAKAALAQAEAQVAEAEFDVQNTQELYDQGAATEQELVIAKAKYESAVAARSAAASNVTQAELNLGYTRITAPISGRINQSRVDVGNLVGLGEPTLLSTIVTWSPMYVYFNVGERDVLRLRRERAAEARDAHGDVPVLIRLADGTEYPLAGRIDYVDNRVDPETGTVRVRAVFDNPEEVLVPGIFARVRLPLPAREALLVPEVALQRDLAGYYLLAVDEEGAVSRRNVEVGELIGPARVITAGLADETWVVINGLQRALPGSKVDAQRTTFEPALPARPTTAPTGAAGAAAGGA